MRSVKPGRGPSMMSAVGAAIAAVLGIFWIATAASIGAPPLMTGFGVVFIVLALVSGAYHFYNATSKRRFSAFDITEQGEEPDLFEEAPEAPRFCPYCGKALREDFVFCPACGHKAEGDGKDRGDEANEA